jgi:mono/diheme cytochrome c family protein
VARPNGSATAAAEAALVLTALALCFLAGAVGFVLGRETAPDNGAGTAAAETTTAEEAETETAETETETAETQTETEAETTETGGGGGGDAEAGEQVFADAGCGSCHTFSAAESTGTVGPNLDEASPSEEEAVETITNGRGAMPAFEGRLSEDEIRAVAAFVSQG